MKKMTHWLMFGLLAALVAIFAVSACDDDDDNDTAADADADSDADGDADSDSDSDADSDSDTGGASDGFGDVCKKTADCTKTADFCMAQPGQAGKCTYTDCTDGSCPTGYKCCDCAALQNYPVMCVDDNSVKLFIGNVCKCEK